MQILSPNHSNNTHLANSEPLIIEKHLEDTFETLRIGEGGLRTQGHFKQSLLGKPLVTVITVVYNGIVHLEETILSVIGQTYDNIEYIIIDGGSTDGTLDIICRYEHVIDYWMSGKDGGIYDAMNKGIDLATGDWINFMNAGDYFYNTKVMDLIFNNVIYKNIVVIYGDHEVRYKHKKCVAKAGNINNIWKGSQFSHQSAFISTCFHKKNKFNLFNKISSDFEFFYKARKENAGFQKTEIILSSIESGGVSDVKRLKSIYERWRIIENNPISFIFYIFLAIKEIAKKPIKFLLKT